MYTLLTMPPVIPVIPVGPDGQMIGEDYFIKFRSILEQVLNFMMSHKILTVGGVDVNFITLPVAILAFNIIVYLIYKHFFDE